MRFGVLAAMIGLAGLCAGTASAQSWVDQGWRDAPAAPGAADRQLQTRETLTAPNHGFGAEANLSPWAATSRDVWIEGDGHTDLMRVRRASEPAPLDPGARDAVEYDVSYIRGWPSTLGYTADGMAVTFTPHAGVGMGAQGSVAEAGATVRIGHDLVPDGQEQFGDRARWYFYAAGSGRAVGYNFARTRDGEYARSGVSHDSGAFLGDAQLGVAMRRGAMQSSIGLVYREIEPGGMRRGIGGIDTDVSEGMVAFQLSIKPE